MGWSTVNKLQEFFHTDWGAMSFHDWLGLGITIVVFFVMVALYVYVFHPANKARFEAQRNIPLDDEHFNMATPETKTTGESTEGKK
jgi:cytochrome c oxidase cbb3-type subunit 4